MLIAIWYMIVEDILTDGVNAYLYAGFGIFRTSWGHIDPDFSVWLN